MSHHTFHYYELPPELGIENHLGYFGSFTRNQATGAIANGTRISKIDYEPGDSTPLYTEGVVLGSIFVPEVSKHIMYFLEWDNRPKFAVSCSGWKIAPLAG